MNTPTNAKLVIVGLVSFILGGTIMHFSGRQYMDHGMNIKSNKQEMQGHQMQGGTMMNMGEEGMMKKSGESNMDMGQMSMNDMATMMRGKTGKELEKEFLNGMIPHHQGAVNMAKVILSDNTTSPQIRVFAENILKAQDAEILQMKKWLAEYK
jgi:uncharacterized protein (DUF305 family)